MDKVVDAVNSVSGLPPTSAFLLGVLLGFAAGVGTFLWFRRKGLVLKKEEPPVL